MCSHTFRMKGEPVSDTTAFSPLTVSGLGRREVAQSHLHCPWNSTECSPTVHTLGPDNPSEAGVFTLILQIKTLQPTEMT